MFGTATANSEKCLVWHPVEHFGSWFREKPAFLASRSVSHETSYFPLWWVLICCGIDWYARRVDLDRENLSAD